MFCTSFALSVWPIRKWVLPLEAKMIGRSQGSIITGTRVLSRSASVASALTHRDCTEFFDHRTMTALAPLSAFSIATSKASPERNDASHQTVKPSR